MQQCDINGESPAAKEAGHVREKDGDIRRSSRIDRLSCVRSHEQRPMMKAAGETFRDVRRSPVRMQVDDLNILQRMIRIRLTTAGECVDQYLGERVGSMDKHALTGSNGAYRLFRAHEHAWVTFHAGYASLPYGRGTSLCISRTAEKRPESARKSGY